MTDAPTPSPTIEHYLDQAYFHGVGIRYAGPDPAIAAAAAGFDKTDLQERLAKLNAVRERCVVSKVRAAFLERVLARMG